jgi:hypothetical protein
VARRWRRTWVIKILGQQGHQTTVAIAEDFGTVAHVVGAGIGVGNVAQQLHDSLGGLLKLVGLAQIFAPESGCEFASRSTGGRLASRAW